MLIVPICFQLKGYPLPELRYCLSTPSQIDILQHLEILLAGFGRSVPLPPACQIAAVAENLQGAHVAGYTVQITGFLRASVQDDQHDDVAHLVAEHRPQHDAFRLSL